MNTWEMVDAGGAAALTDLSGAGTATLRARISA
jgi:hypothetical protein